jgi:hypothetical protein
MAAVAPDDHAREPEYEAPALVVLGSVGEVTLDEPSIVR